MSILPEYTRFHEAGQLLGEHSTELQDGVLDENVLYPMIILAGQQVPLNDGCHCFSGGQHWTH